MVDMRQELVMVDSKEKREKKRKKERKKKIEREIIMVQVLMVS